ncbi:MAG: dihydrolipoyl dehydrogenase [Candidatus Eisenbacteria bacterium]|uniref:Dihydrolipoyl dehydrogenase n=1 Tax=Eiseniibacteriota bacterium TaxID=2212470 RepID=A0A538TFG6_UNCEI|nr:MAG: dihydrolipoyl dehydrogenase [Candidatus Eisenbacteria bacterium]
MNGERYDVAILGGGPGGYVAAIRAGQLGLKTALIEKEKVGGTCLHVGCIPTKALLETAEVLLLARRAGELGVRVSEVSLDLKAAMERKDRVVKKNLMGTESLLKKNKVVTIKGTGRVKAKDRIAVTDAVGGTSEVQAGAIVLATGSSVGSLPVAPVDGRVVLSSDDILSLDRVPESLLVIGAGAVGVEFASIYHSFGSKIILIEREPRLMPLEDAEISEALHRSFTRQGMEILVNASIKSVRVEGDQAWSEVEVQGKLERYHTERVLMAAGRKPRTEGIGLEALGVAVERGLVRVSEYMETSVPGIYAIGDIVPGPALAHVASHEGIVAVEKIAGRRPHLVNYQAIPNCTYCHPQIASVGMTEAQARASGRAVKIGKFPFIANSKAGILGQGDGFVKAVADASSGEILGVHIIGVLATEQIAESVVARHFEATALELADVVHAHPTLAEATMEAMFATDGRSIHF